MKKYFRHGQHARKWKASSNKNIYPEAYQIRKLIKAIDFVDHAGFINKILNLNFGLIQGLPGILLHLPRHQSLGVQNWCSHVHYLKINSGK